MKSLSVLAALMLFAAIAGAELLQVDDFENQTVNVTIDGAACGGTAGGLWDTADENVGTIRVENIENSSRKALRVSVNDAGWGEACGFVGVTDTIADGETGTMSLQFKIAGGMDPVYSFMGIHEESAASTDPLGWWHRDGSGAPGWLIAGFGLVDSSTPGQVKMVNPWNTSVTIVDNLVRDQWYNVWIIVDNNTNTYDIYLGLENVPDSWASAGLVAADLVGSGLNFRWGSWNAFAGAYFTNPQMGVVTAQIYLDNIYWDGSAASLPVTGRAINSYPANGVTGIAADTDLEWLGGVDPNGVRLTDITQYYLMLIAYDVDVAPAEPNFLSDSVEAYTVADTGADPVVWENPGTFGQDKVVFWRVDESLNNSAQTDPNTITGNVWSFETLRSVPVITSQPQNIVTDAGQPAQFSIAATTSAGTLGYTWYKVVGSVGGGDDVDVTNLDATPATPETLDLAGVQISDDAGYYCVVDNPLTTQSKVAWLTVKRIIARWEFDGDLTDETGNGWNGSCKVINGDATIVDGTAVYDTGISGQAYNFNNGTNDFVVISGSIEPFGFVSRGYTISCWVNTTSTDWGTFWSKSTRENAGDDSWRGTTLAHANDHVDHNLRNVGSNWGYTGTNNGAWHLLVGTYEPGANTIRLYVDGVLSMTNAGVTTPLNPLTGSVTGQPFVLGREFTMDPVTGNSLSGAGQGYNGLMDDVRVYNYPLSREAIAYLYADVTGESVCVYPNDPALAYDFNNNCKVDLPDFAELASNWLECFSVPDCLERP